MPEFDHERFGQEGLGLDPTSASKYAKSIKSLCLLVGISAGVGLTLTGLSDMARAGQGYAPPAKLNWAMVLAGLGVGTLVVGGACTTIKNKILDHINQYDSTEAAILSLSAQKKVELRSEALRLVQLSEKIEGLYKENENSRMSDANFT